MVGAVSIALGGLLAQGQRLSAAANTIAGVGAEVDLVRETVQLIEIKAAYKANIAVIKTEREMLGDLLDAIA